MQLYHFSDDPGIAVFEPRPVRVPSARPPGREWLNGPLVWAIEADWQAMYLFPRDCPRILLFPRADTTAADRTAWFGASPARALAYVEWDWLEPLRAATLCRYALPSAPFEDLDDAGMWVAREAVTPLACETLNNLPAALREAGVELRLTETLTHLRPVWDTTLHASGIRLRHAKDWT
ncbi:MAG: hypothetical protein Q8L59_03170 [Phenylobacterium sp.]|uniref:DUF6886 family protein n=1 Tax=Phenylobacterium sp. TaxID=1871053 RepID=UPI002734AB07|nr:DUF6886 family protein [Phenylobacterium sp.]MDP1641167.1 hypothetical protein [Phenylobacterium sp.]MDP3118161.1 hypothetical protein [Phenylobacterium sp.]MDP3383083.1 hypothetical protein [Phenylobacterium sp.]